jgi:hypothetical protein
MRYTELQLPYKGLGQQMSGQVINVCIGSGLVTHIKFVFGLQSYQLNTTWTKRTSGLLGSLVSTCSEHRKLTNSIRACHESLVPLFLTTSTCMHYGVKTKDTKVFIQIYSAIQPWKKYHHNVNILKCNDHLEYRADDTHHKV